MFRFLCCCLLFSQLVFAKELVTIAVGEWSPYISEKLKYQGVVGRIVRNAFALEGVEVQFRYYPWSRALDMNKKGLFHGTAPWYITEDRKKLFLYSEDYICRISTVFFHLKTFVFNWKDYKDIGSRFKIGGTIGYLYSEGFQKAIKDKTINVEWVATDELNLKKLFKRRIDIFPNDIMAGYAKVYELFPKQISEMVTNHPRMIKDDPAYLMISKEIPNSEELVKKFNRGLSKLKASGQFDKYYDELLEGKYIIEEKD